VQLHRPLDLGLFGELRLAAQVVQIILNDLVTGMRAGERTATGNRRTVDVPAIVQQRGCFTGRSCQAGCNKGSDHQEFCFLHNDNV